MEPAPCLPRLQPFGVTFPGSPVSARWLPPHGRSLPALRPGRSRAGQSLAAVNGEATVILRRLFCPPPMQGFPGRICDLAPQHMSSVWLKYILKKYLLKKLLLLLPREGSCQALSSFSCASDKSLSEWPRRHGLALVRVTGLSPPASAPHVPPRRAPFAGLATTHAVSQCL